MKAELDNFQQNKRLDIAPWQQVTQANNEHWHIFMALYFETHRLPWLKNGIRLWPTWNPLCNNYVLLMVKVETDLPSRQ